MIVSALVVTPRSSAGALLDTLEQDARIRVGRPQHGFIPLVTTAETLGMAREIFEALRAKPDVQDVQLVSWADENELADETSFSGSDDGKQTT